MERETALTFEGTVAYLQKVIHETCRAKGFWEVDPADATPELILAKLALVHCEVSECIEEVRRHEPRLSEKLPEMFAEEEELADAVIRILDYAEARGFNLGRAILAKAAFNTTRPPKHGRRC